jgi:hypothetical protein
MIINYPCTWFFCFAFFETVYAILAAVFAEKGTLWTLVDRSAAYSATLASGATPTSPPAPALPPACAPRCYVPTTRSVISTDRVPSFLRRRH